MKTPDRFDLSIGHYYNLVRCGDCQHIYLNPRPLETVSGKYYENSSYSPHISTQSALSLQDRLYMFLRQFNNKNKRRLIAKHAPNTGKLLDLGCGTGEFIMEMQSAGWEVQGVERDEKAAEFGRTENGLPILTGTLQDLTKDAGPFNVVTMWHVLEHIYSPITEIEHIYNFLVQDGFLVLAVPNAASIDAKYYQNNWIAWDTPRHVNHFHLKSLQKFLEMHKFKLVQKSNLSLDSLFNALMSEQLIAQRKGASSLEKAGMMVRAAIVGKVSLLAGLLSPLLQQSRGASLLTVWQKSEN
ncbi:MAG: class I SAM-dependent methyltransferase [Deferribacteres bacterium]|nr:class I SAM-dependent methyltransferase [candidate division KSB1 bacterium]MCB9502241.1 class I SAM-dependent methyltransferase [Deferribacteres bacterium]